jgi:hypothetical protein
MIPAPEGFSNSLSGALYRAAESFTTQKWRKGANNGHA